MLHTEYLKFVIYGLMVLAIAILGLIQYRGIKYFQTYTYRWLIFIAAAYVFGLIGMAAYCFYFFLYELKASFAIKDTVTSRIASAAQGYVEIIGKGKPDISITAPLSGITCLWYDYTEHKNKSIWPNWMTFDSDDWELISSGKSEEPFVINDGTATCQVNPAGAQMSELDYTVWYEGDRRYKELLLLTEKDVFVLGNFTTQGEEFAKVKFNREVAQLINDWKSDQTTLKQRFDLDNDGAISLKEMELIRLQAQREVKNQTKISFEPLHTISKPQDRRPFIISHHPHSKLVSRHRLHGFFYLAMFLLLATQINFANIGAFAHKTSKQESPTLTTPLPKAQ